MKIVLDISLSSIHPSFKFRYQASTSIACGGSLPCAGVYFSAYMGFNSTSVASIFCDPTTLAITKNKKFPNSFIEIWSLLEKYIIEIIIRIYN